ncbi:MAG: DUF5043 domain-containing protein [Alistipes sp.]
MKRLIILCCLLFAAAGYGQTPEPAVNYYAKDGTVSATDGTVYCIDGADSSIITISNAENRYSTVDASPSLYYKDGRRLETLEEYGRVDGAVADQEIVNRILRDMFTDEQIVALRNLRLPLAVGCTVDPETGVQLEVKFAIGNYPEMTSLPPDFYRTFEKRLKEEVRWNVNDFAKQLKYMFGLTIFNFRKLPLTSELHQIKPGLGRNDQNLNQGEDVGSFH